MVLPTEAGDTPKLEIGQRVECDGYFGTLKFVGEIEDSTGIWLGIDWDDCSRGKHDGTHQGASYFKSHSATSGSFVRPEKLNFGVSCLQAIRERYGEVHGDEFAGVDRKSLFALQREMNAPFISLVGFDRVNRQQSRFDQLTIAGLRNQFVNGAGEPGKLEKLCPGIVEIDLSKNLLSDWQSIADIAKELEELRILNVSENRLQIPQDPSILQKFFRHLEHLIMAKMDYTWVDVQLCASMWQQIKVLQVPFNKISNIELSSSDTFTKLEKLDLEGNVIADWNEINKLGTISTLRFLNVSNTGIKEIAFPVDENCLKTKLFQGLQELIIDENQIGNWTSISELNKLKLLTELKFRDNPLLQMDRSERNRENIIAKIGKLKVCNCVNILQAERKEAEFDYLRRYFNNWQSAKDDEEKLQSFYVEHPRFQYLLDRYGIPEEGDLDIPREGILKSKLITIQICNSIGRADRFVKSIYSAMTIQKLAALVQKLYQKKEPIPTLYHISMLRPDVEVLLDKLDKEFSFYSPGDGDIVCARW